MTMNPEMAALVILPSARDIARTFLEYPTADHGPMVRQILFRMRWGAAAGKLVLIKDQPAMGWFQLARLVGGRGASPEIIEGAFYGSIADAERDLFIRRWQSLTGCQLDLA